MATKTPTIKPKDRVRHADGTTGTVIDVHKERGRLGVLPDVGAKALRTWTEVEVTRLSGPARGCKRCGASDHIAIDCTGGAQ